jgi:hypothetical protein
MMFRIPLPMAATALLTPWVWSFEEPAVWPEELPEPEASASQGGMGVLIEAAQLVVRPASSSTIHWFQLEYSIRTAALSGHFVLPAAAL